MLWDVMLCNCYVGGSRYLDLQASTLRCGFLCKLSVCQTVRYRIREGHNLKHSLLITSNLIQHK
jgi:hypothetical protein